MALKLLKLGLVGCLVLCLAGVVAVACTGILTVKVEQKGPDGLSLSLPIPVLLGSLALAVAPDDAFQDVGPELACWTPVLQETCQALAASPDGVLVEVETEEARAFIAKEGGDLIIDVTTPEETVRVELPLRSVARWAGKIAARGAMHSTSAGVA